jgi:5-methylcytosine-specific restriction endonuclease McrA
MSWINLDDGILEHPKFIRAVNSGGADALHLWLGLRAYCAKHLTDGFVPADMLDEVRGPKKPREREKAFETLISVGLLHREEDGGLQMHDYLDWAPSRAKVLEDKRIAARRSALRASPELMRLVKERDCGLCRYCGVMVDWGDRRGPLGGTYDHVNPVSRGGGDEFENIVTACRGCNLKKGGRLPEEARMVLAPPTGREPVARAESVQVPLQSYPKPKPNQSKPKAEFAPASADATEAKVVVLAPAEHSDTARLQDHYARAFQAAKGVPHKLAKGQGGRYGKAAKELVSAVGLPEACAIVDRALADQWQRDHRPELWELAADMNKFRGSAAAPAGRHGAAPGQNFALLNARIQRMEREEAEREAH